MTKRIAHIVLLLLLCAVPTTAKETKPNKAEVFFYRVGRWMDNFMLRGLDTTYITLPEHSWRVAFTNGEVGFNSSFTNWHDPATYVTIATHSTPSLDLGFNAGFRGIGFGYAWDVLHAHSTNMNLSLGSKGYGLEFTRVVSTNMEGNLKVDDIWEEKHYIKNGDMRTSYTSLSAWLALNKIHYSHNAAIKQDYIQRKTAGSLLLSVAYMSYKTDFLDTLRFKDDDDVYFFDGMSNMITRQVAVGIGYGINYTPNHGKVLLHAAANMQLVCYSINHISLFLPDSIRLPAEPQYMLSSSKPVHVTGNMRAAVSWEINEWVHLSAWAQVNNVRFSAKGDVFPPLKTSSWHWQAHLTVGVRFGAGKKRVNKVLGITEQVIAPEDLPEDAKPVKLPQWLTDYFFSYTKK